MRIPKSEFTDADIALCRAHGDAAAHDANFRELKRWNDRPGTVNVAYLAACRDFERVTLDQAQSDAYWQWQHEVQAPTKAQIVEAALKTLAPAKPAAPQPHQAPTAPLAPWWRRGSDVPVSERVGLWHVWNGDQSANPGPACAGFNFRSESGLYRVAAPGVREGEPYDESKYATADHAADVWHSGAPSVPGVYIADTKECVAESSERASRWLRYFDGALWSNAWRESMSDIDKARTKSLRTGADIMWLRLIEADAPAASGAADGAALVGAKLTHSVCIKAHVDEWDVGDIMAGGTASFAHPDNWRACDANGWIPHIPAADSVCPVPDGVEYDALRRSGTVTLFGGVPDNAWQIGFKYDRSPGPGDVVAWRPIAKVAS